jgi:hypothetical protein
MNWSSELQKLKKIRKRPRTVALARLPPFTIEMNDIYKLILWF